MKHTKGKQRIEMKEIEDYEDRMTTFSKRKAGIVKKMNEIVTLCDADASFLVFTQAGKPHTFAHPSMEDAIAQVKSPLGHEPSGGNGANTGPLVEAYMRQKDEELKKLNVDFAEVLEMEEEKEKTLKESKSEKKLDEMWWNDEGLSVEELKQRRQSLLELNVSLCGKSSQCFEKDGGDEADARE